MSQEEDKILQKSDKILQEQVERLATAKRELEASDERVKQYNVELRRIKLNLKIEDEIRIRIAEENKAIEKVINLATQSFHKLYAK